MDRFCLIVFIGAVLCSITAAQDMVKHREVFLLTKIGKDIEHILKILNEQQDKLASLEESHRLIEGKQEEQQSLIKESMEISQQYQEETKAELKTCDYTRNDVATLLHLLGTDECAQRSHNCSEDAVCTDTWLSHRCKCNEGFTGDGYTCEDIDECADADACIPQATCTNTKGHYSCICNSGFTGDGHTCQDIDECADVNKCDPQAACINIPGNYSCKCNQGFLGDGHTCEGCVEPFKNVQGVGCIHTITSTQNWESGRAKCNSFGGEYFVANDKEHYLRLAQHFIDINFKEKQKYMFVGVKEGQWLSGRSVAPEEEAPGNPTMGSATCSYTDGDNAQKFLLWTDPCVNSRGALCQPKA